jgi:hypothetical protein
MEAEPMGLLQFAKRSVVTLALVSLTLAGCGGESTPDAPFNPAGTSADLEAMNETFASPAFASFSTFSVMFDAAMGGSPIIASSAAAIDVRGAKTPAGMRAAAARGAQRLAGFLMHQRMSASAGHSGSAMMISSTIAGKTFVYDPNTSSYAASDVAGAPATGVRFLLYAVDPVSYAPVEPLVETGYVDLIDMSAGSTQAARVLVVSGGITYVDYTVSVSTGTTSGRVSVTGMITDGTNQANIVLRSTLTSTAGLTLTYSLDLPQRDVSVDLSVNATDVSQVSSPITISLTMRGPNGTIAMTGQFTDTSGNLNIRVNGAAFATITTDGTTTTITRSDGTALSDDELVAMEGIFEVQSGAFTSFDQMLAPVGGFFQ